MARDCWRRCAHAVFTCALTLGLVQMGRAESFASNMSCSNGVLVTPCKVDFNNTTLTIILSNGDQLIARRLGRWTTTTAEGKTERSCNMRIDLGDEVVYGLLQISATEGAQLTWSRGRISVLDFQEPSP